MTPASLAKWTIRTTLNKTTVKDVKRCLFGVRACWGAWCIPCSGFFHALVARGELGNVGSRAVCSLQSEASSRAGIRPLSPTARPLRPVLLMAAAAPRRLQGSAGEPLDCSLVYISLEVTFKELLEVKWQGKIN